MRSFNTLTSLIIVILIVLFCLIQFNPKKPATLFNTCQQQDAAASISEAEDFSLINLLTLKFM